MRTYSIQTLGCKVNQYESEQLALVLRRHGLTETPKWDQADVRIVNTCSVTVQAASKSRQTTRRRVRSSGKQRVIVTGCWATGDKAEASKLAGVDAVLTHHEDVAGELKRLLFSWGFPDSTASATTSTQTQTQSTPSGLPSEPFMDGWMRTGGFPAGSDVGSSKTISLPVVKQKIGMVSLPMLEDRQEGHQRAFLKVQDGCDAHCTYCIIPQLRPTLWSKPVGDVVEEARRLVAAGHQELVLTGIFLSAYGQATALRRRQLGDGGSYLAQLLREVCEGVPNLRRLRLSSLEPGDLNEELVGVMRGLPQVVPHFHLPLQSGSNALLRRMNRQYTREDFLVMVERVNEAFDRPALTTDIIVGFPGETDEEFERTLEVVERAKFIHVHAFSYSARPRTAAARWEKDFVRGPVVNERLNLLRRRAGEHSVAYRRQFLNEAVEILVERPGGKDVGIQHGRCERYFDVHFEADEVLTGRAVKVRVDRVTPARTHGTVLEVGGRG